MNNIPPVSRLISFSPTCSLLLPWQASLAGNVGSGAANPVVFTLHRLCSSEIPKPLLVSWLVTPPRHNLPALPSKIGELRQKLILAEEFISIFVPQELCKRSFTQIPDLGI